MSEVAVEALPSLLTVEEAARVLRVGRTKAYAMAQEWRASGGRSGLPVVDFGNVLRVPRCQLEALLGGPLTAIVAPVDACPAGNVTRTDDPDAKTDQDAPIPAPEALPAARTNDSTTRRPRRTRRLTESNQPSLFDSLPD